MTPKNLSKIKEIYSDLTTLNEEESRVRGKILTKKMELRYLASEPCNDTEKHRDEAFRKDGGKVILIFSHAEIRYVMKDDFGKKYSEPTPVKHLVYNEYHLSSDGISRSTRTRAMFNPRKPDVTFTGFRKCNRKNAIKDIKRAIGWFTDKIPVE